MYSINITVDVICTKIDTYASDFAISLMPFKMIDLPWCVRPLEPLAWGHSEDTHTVSTHIKTFHFDLLQKSSKKNLHHCNGHLEFKEGERESQTDRQTYECMDFTHF